MKLKKTSGHVVHSPLSFIFQMVELGGSYIQKYDAMSQSFAPNRRLTPYVLQPQLIVSDPDGTLPTADYSSQLVNLVWTATFRTGDSTEQLLPNNDTYAVDNVTGRLTVYVNVPPAGVLSLAFRADFVDTRRGETHHMEWSRDLGCEAQTNLNASLDTGRWRGRMLLSPFKHWGQFSIPLQLHYGENVVPDAYARYQWQWWNATARAWVSDFSEQPWLVSGEQTKEIVLDQDFIQNVLLRCVATPYNNSQAAQTFVTRLKRWYGQYEEDVEFKTGKYVFHDTRMVVLEGKVTNRQGNIRNLSLYFDVELFFSIGNGGWESVGYGEEAIIRRNDLQDGSPRAGILCRELSAYRALADDSGKVLCMDDDKPLFAQFPTTSRETV